MARMTQIDINLKAREMQYRFPDNTQQNQLQVNELLKIQGFTHGQREKILHSWNGYCDFKKDRERRRAELDAKGGA